MKKLIIFLFTLFIFHIPFSTFACQCPLTRLSLDECLKYDIIFRGKIKKDTLFEGKKGQATFEVLELYKGVIPADFNVLFDTGTECAQAFVIGDEWIIYTNYKQTTNAKMDWCSRSRKYFKNDKLDFYTVTYGNSYDDELTFLRNKLGLYKPLKASEAKPDWQGNQIPTRKEFIIYLLLSIIGVVVFIYLFKRFFKW